MRRPCTWFSMTRLGLVLASLTDSPDWAACSDACTWVACLSTCNVRSRIRICWISDASVSGRHGFVSTLVAPARTVRWTSSSVMWPVTKTIGMLDVVWSRRSSLQRSRPLIPRQSSRRDDYIGPPAERFRESFPSVLSFLDFITAPAQEFRIHLARVGVAVHQEGDGRSIERVIFKRRDAGSHSVDAPDLGPLVEAAVMIAKAPILWPAA